MHASRGLSTLVISVGAALLVAACTTGSANLSLAPAAPAVPTASSGAPSTAAATAAQAAISPSATPAATLDPDVSPLPAGRQSALVIGTGTYPEFTVVVPADWYAESHFVLKYAAGGPGPVLGLSVWDVGQVPLDPCHWSTTLRDPGPGVDALVRALASQAGRRATTPVKVTLAGQSGQYLEWSVPGWVVTGDADFAGCDDPGNGHHDFVSWFATDPAGERYEQVAGQVDRLWVLDVKGQRLVVDGTYSPDTTPADRAELASVVASLRFQRP